MCRIRGRCHTTLALCGFGVMLYGTLTLGKSTGEMGSENKTLLLRGLLLRGHSRHGTCSIVDLASDKPSHSPSHPRVRDRIRIHHITMPGPFEVWRKAETWQKRNLVASAVLLVWAGVLYVSVNVLLPSSTATALRQKSNNFFPCVLRSGTTAVLQMIQRSASD